ncbi:MAG: DUF4920 domain-containing protein, partial [Marinirhabdus sp.]
LGALKPGDTIPVKFAGQVTSVCQAKGCWMKLEMPTGETTVKFKDYGFFVPKNLAGTQVIVEGTAFVNEMSVEELRHFAEDAGKPKEEILKITQPKRTPSVIASGVLVPSQR